MNFLYILGWPLGYVMEAIYTLIPNYGWDIILFTILVSLIRIPLALSQQKNTARMSAFQPMIEEIQKKYKDKPEKQQEELTRLQQDYGYNPASGCLPMLLNFFVMFGVIEVVYRPLQRIFHISTDALTAAGEALTALGIQFSTVTRDTHIIAQVAAGESTVMSAFTDAQIERIVAFSQNMKFFGIDLTQVPKFSLEVSNLPLLIFPVLAIVTMFISTYISMNASGQKLQGSMKVTMYMMPLMYVFFCFTVPTAFSLYYVVSNILMSIQSEVMRRIYDPVKIREQVEAEIAAKKKEQKRGVKSTTVKVVDEKTGNTVEKNLSASVAWNMHVNWTRSVIVMSAPPHCRKKARIRRNDCHDPYHRSDRQDGRGGPRSSLRTTGCQCR
jgi:YidC/Oxa1 family membrane protein insertase